MADKPTRDLYELLQLEPSATTVEIKQAIQSERVLWGRRARSAPDAERRAGAEQHVAKIADAETILLDPKRRAQYDASLGIDQHEREQRRRQEDAERRERRPDPREQRERERREQEQREQREQEQREREQQERAREQRERERRERERRERSNSPPERAEPSKPLEFILLRTEGSRALNIGDFKKALTAATNLVKVFPDDEDAMLFFARTAELIISNLWVYDEASGEYIFKSKEKASTSRDLAREALALNFHDAALRQRLQQMLRSSESYRVIFESRSSRRERKTRKKFPLGWFIFYVVVVILAGPVFGLIGWGGILWIVFAAITSSSKRNKDR